MRLTLPSYIIEDYLNWLKRPMGTYFETELLHPDYGNIFIRMPVILKEIDKNAQSK